MSAGVQSFMRISLAIVVVLVATAVAAAPQAPGQESQPTGSGAITGQVLDAGTGAYLAHAAVWLRQTRGDTPIGVSPRSERLTTDSSGGFAFRNPPAGQFSIEASAEGYQPGAIGKRRPQGESSWISLEDGQTFSGATIELFRGGTIAGIVRNDRGEPMREVHVETWFRTGSGRLEYRHGAITNEAGIYRITAVPAGDHFVVGRVWHHTIRQGPPNATSPCNPPVPPPPDGAPKRPAPVEKPKYAEGEWFTRLPRWIPEPDPDDQGQPRTIATTIYPGVSEVSQASVVRILGGEDRTDIDLQFRPTHATSIKGRIVPLPGKRIGKGSEVRLRLPGAPSDLIEHTTWVQPDNTFRFLGVPAGTYVLEVQPQEAVECDVIVRHAEDVRTQMELDVPPTGLDDVIVHMTAGAAMHGGIRFEGTTPPAQIMDIWMLPTSDATARIGEWARGHHSARPEVHSRREAAPLRRPCTLFQATTSLPPSTNAAWMTGHRRNFSRVSRSKPFAFGLIPAGRGLYNSRYRLVSDLPVTSLAASRIESDDPAPAAN